MSNTAKVRLVGQHDAAMIEKLCVVVINQWVSLHRYGRSDAPLEVKSRLLEVIGGGVFEWCWATRGIYGEPLQRDNAMSLAQLRDHLCKPSVRPTLCNKVSFTVSMISARMCAIATLAKKAKGKEARELWQGYHCLFAALNELLDTGALAEMPNSSRNARLHDNALAKLTAILPVRYALLKRHSAASGQIGLISASLGTTLGLALFAGVRAQEEGRVSPGAEGLMAWYQAPHVRKQRGFYAELGAGIHALCQAAMELRKYRDSAPKGAPRRKTATEAIILVEETMIAVINSGALYSIP